MSDPCNVKRLWCLKTRGYHVFPSGHGRAGSVWIHDGCLICGHKHNTMRQDDKFDPYTYEDDPYIYEATCAIPKHEAVHLRSCPNLTDLQEHD